MKMTRVKFERFLQSIRFGIAIRGPYAIVKCTCRDINCHGWRLVRGKPQRASAKRRVSNG
jgi:hypothetical protein